LIDRTPKPKSVDGRANLWTAGTSYWRTVTVCALIPVILAVMLFIRSMAVAEVPRKTIDLTPSSTARTTWFTSRLADGITCRYQLFDNDSAEISRTISAPCDESRGKIKERARAPKGFVWGGR
jgi:hypothetical protein